MTMGFIMIDVLSLVWGIETCGCFGNTRMSPQTALFIDALMLVMAAGIVLSKTDLARLDSWFNLKNLLIQSRLRRR
jgi:hypothetical protein